MTTYEPARDPKAVAENSAAGGHSSWIGAVDPDLGVFLVRTLGKARHREIDSTVLRIEDRSACPLGGRHGPQGLVMIGIPLADNGDRPLAAGGVDSPPPRVEGEVVDVAGDRDARDDQPRVAVHDDERRARPASDEQPMIGLVD